MASISPLLSILPYSQIKNQTSNRQNKSRGINHVPCRASNGDSTSKFDRRDVLFGLGGLYGAAALTNQQSPASAKPLAPDVNNCEPATIVGNEHIPCCPPKIHDIIDFIHPPHTTKLRIRQPAHSLTPKQQFNFEKAIHIMKRLSPNDPRNFYRQADVHCAYCDYAYKQLGFPNAEMQVHWNALFFPFHRAYLYFFERILGHLINEPDFAIPFWNWDNKKGMQMPEIYDHPNSPLYDKLRNQRHRPHKLLNLNYHGDDNPPYDVVDCNLRWMHKQMITDADTAEGFHGKLLVASQEANEETGMGTIERSPHNNIHNWVGDPNAKNNMNMGVFYSAARDPLFYGHHANVDRMWSIWQGLKNGKPRDFNNPDWLNSSFVFYNEHKQAVRIKVSDCLDTRRLGYVYQYVDLPWLHTKQTPRLKKQLKTTQAPQVIKFPQGLNSMVTTTVKRPKKLRDEKEKSEKDEVLVIEGIELDKRYWVHFNVLVNVVDDGSDVCPGNTEFVGTFTTVLHGHNHRGKTSLRVVITEVLKELGIEDDESVIVRLDPKVGGDKVTIGGMKIELQPKGQPKGQ
ncbi:polyphenol oxidase, chloroplastic-like [Cucurbita maxima]|uniref:Polyphenol oxidase, chloroplastic-like n=1 Tax=Cucurbita maxima TaxID=3661 RepID=A0A6J1K2N9_CUCMA|nr:polyphenol oxidase, chloroplastic-like [Cucurbita maxima]